MPRALLCILCLLACASASSRRRVKPDTRRRVSPGAPYWTVRGAPNPSKEHCGFKLLPNNKASMRPVEVFHATKEIGAYNHAVMMDWHQGNLLLTWKNSPVDEDTPGQRILYSQSLDGETWTQTDGNNVMFPNMTTAATPAALFGGPTAVINGRRYATASPHQFCLFPPPLTSPVLMRRVTGFPAQLGPIFWLAQELPDGFEEASKRENVTTLQGMDKQTQADAATLRNFSQVPCNTSQSLKCEACVDGCDYPSFRYGLGGGAEFSRYTIPNSTKEIILHRTREHVLGYTSRATVGDSWSNQMQTGIVDADSNLNTGTLPDGRVFLLSNACSKGRDPLVLSTSVDGLNFNHAVGVMSCETLDGQCHPRVKGKSKHGGQAYPQAVAVTEPESMRYLWVAATNNKEDVWVARVTYDAI